MRAARAGVSAGVPRNAHASGMPDAVCASAAPCTGLPIAGPRIKAWGVEAARIWRLTGPDWPERPGVHYHPQRDVAPLG
jgi:hypothetical protein